MRSETEPVERGKEDGGEPADGPAGELAAVPHIPLTDAEAQSLTTEDFHVPDALLPHYREGIQALNEAGVLFAMGGLYALHAYTGLHRETKDLDLLLPSDEVVDAARALKARGFAVRLHDRHWLAKADRGEASLDLVYGLANGLYPVDPGALRRAPRAHFLGEPVRIDPPEDLVLHRLFILERHRNDLSDVAHLLLHRGPELDWEWLVDRIGGYWRLLLTQILLFDFIYPDFHDRVPAPVRENLLRRALTDAEEERARDPGSGAGASPAGRGAPIPAPEGSVCQGPLISRFSFAVDVNEWGFRDYRTESVEAARRLPHVEQIAASDVWEEGDRGEAGEESEGP